MSSGDTTTLLTTSILELGGESVKTQDSFIRKWLLDIVSILEKKWITILIWTLSADNPQDISISNLKYICYYEYIT